MSDDGNHSGQIAPEALSRLYAMTSVRRPASLDNLPDDVDALKQRLVEAEWKATAAESVVREVRAREEGVLDTLAHIGKRATNAFSQKPPSILGERKIIFRTAAQIEAAGIPETEWLIDGVKPKGALVLLSGAPKGGGKTTYATHEVKGQLRGDMSCLGMQATKTPVVYLTEQAESNFFNEYLRPVGIDRSDDLHLVFGYEVAGLPWPLVVEQAVERCLEVGALSLYFDTFLHFAHLSGDQENSSGAVHEAFAPLQHAAAQHGLTITVVHHDRKGGGSVYESGRGSSAFQADPDLIINLTLPVGNHRPTIREMRTAGRYSEVPGKLLIELVEGKYVALGSESDVAAQVARRLALDVAPTDEGAALQMKELVEAAREHDSHVKKTTFENEVKKHVSFGKLRVIGAGKKNDPYKYFRPS